jgi:hypothetical protein
MIPVLKRLFIQNFCKRSRCLEENPVFLFLSKKKMKKKEFSPSWIWFNTNRRYKWYCCLLLFLAWLITESVYNDAFRTFTISMQQCILILVLHLRQFFIVRIFVKRATVFSLLLRVIFPEWLTSGQLYYSDVMILFDRKSITAGFC